MKMNEKGAIELDECDARMNSSNTDECIILEEPAIPTINLDESIEDEQMCNCESGSLSEAILKIRFKDNATYIELSSAIISSIKSTLFYLQKSVLFTEDPTNLTITFNETSTTDDDGGLFIVDSTPSQTPVTSDFIPEYSRCGVEINDRTADAIKEPIAKPAQNGNSCFNCGGNHAIRECTKPKDLNKIKQNRTKFSNNKISYERYHVDVEQKFGHLVAGELTKELRSALGLRSKELPEHIYRMRQIGYPPGWLLHAKVLHSGLSMFGSQEKEDKKEEDIEDKYDLKKILSFPGFNVVPPSGTLDKGRDYRSKYMSMDLRYSKSAMLDALKSKSTKAYKKKVVKSAPAPDVTVLEPTDMDIDDESDNDEQSFPAEGPLQQLPCLPTSGCLPTTNSTDYEPPIPGIQSPVSDGEIVDTETKRPCSPSLKDLTERKQLLLAALDDSTISVSSVIKPLMNSTVNNDDSLIDDIIALDHSSIQESRINEECDDCSPSKDHHLLESTAQVEPKLMHTSIERMIGTPVIKRVSAYSDLPSGQNWAVGVTDVIDFENLPNSVGKYETMRTLIGKVRASVKRIQYEDDEDDNK